MSYSGDERREQNFCASHERQLDDVDQLKLKVSSIRGWQVALSFFITLCFVTVVTYAGNTNASVAEVARSVSKIDKQVATIVASDAAFKKQTRSDISEIKRRLELIEREK
jgi:hypothetical protein